MNSKIIFIIASLFLSILPHNHQGVHLLVEMWGQNFPQSTTEAEALLQHAVKAANSTLLSVNSHQFEPNGITAVAILSESHISIHTWPEFNYIALDIFTCGNKSKPHKALEYICSILRPKHIQVQEVMRGISLNVGVNVPRITHQFGKELVIDIYGCNPQTIRSKEKILEFSSKLVKLLKVKPFGEPFIERFALHVPHLAGYSFAQMIETSLVSGHFSELTDCAYINIFSCAPFDELQAARFTAQFFQAKSVNYRVIER